MTEIKKAARPVTWVVLLAGAIGYLLGSTVSEREVGDQVDAAQLEQENKTGAHPEATGAIAPAASPVKALAGQDVYYPGSEDLAPDEMRVVACGTGMPNARPKQAAACWLVELGNGDKFIFDIGTGSATSISAALSWKCTSLTTKR